MAEQFDEGFFNVSYPHVALIPNFNDWGKTNEGSDFWNDIYNLYYLNETIEHQQILNIFHEHGIEP